MSAPAFKPLAQTLGFAHGDSVFVETTPDWYTDFADKLNISLEPGVPATHAHIFCEHEAELADFLDNTELEDVGTSLWISWPKRDSAIRTDLGEQEIRSAMLPLGWAAANDTVAIDDTWLGLQFLRQKT